jgi:hypothetical protein
VVKLEWGSKRTCGGCSARFYDLRKSPIACPKCGTVLELHAVGRGKRGRAAASTKIAFEDDIAVIEDLSIDDGFDAGLEEDEALIEDSDVLDDTDVHSDLDRI